MSYPLSHAASGAGKGPGTQPSRPTTRELVVQSPTSDKGDINMIDFIKYITF